MLKPKIVLLILAGGIISFCCRRALSKQDEDYIKTQIVIHNTGYSIKFIIDSTNNYESYVKIYAGKGLPQAEHLADSLIQIDYKNRNNPYSPEFDAHLTYERFIQYCKEKNVNPRKRVEVLVYSNH